MRRVADTVSRYWPVSVVAWGVAAVLAVVVAPPFEQVAAFDEAIFLAPDSPALEGQRLTEEAWPDDDFTRSATLALVRPGRPLDEGDARYLHDIMAWRETPDGPVAFGSVASHLREPDPEAVGEAYGRVTGRFPPGHPQAGAPVQEGYDGLVSASDQLLVALDAAGAGTGGLDAGLAQLDGGLAALDAGLAEALAGTLRLQAGLADLLTITGPAAFLDEVDRAAAGDFPVIVGAATLGVFLVLVVLLRSLVAPTYITQLGLAAAVGILLDTFVVRALLVPSLAVLLGRWNWWPSARAAHG